MSDEKTQTFLWGILIAAVTGLYGFFVKHLIGHADKRETAEQIQQLWDKKQSTDRCGEIVKRIDENHQEICRKLDRILEYQEKGGPTGRVRT